MMQPQRPQQKKRFRWWIVSSILAVLFAAWVIDRIDPAFEWQDLVQSVGARYKPYAQLACLGLTICAVCVIARILGYGKKRGE